LMKTMLRQFSGGEIDGDRARFDFFADKFAHLPLYFLKFHGSTHVDEVLDAMDYACYVLDVGHVVLDNLQFMLSGQARGHEVWDMQNSAIEKFRRFATVKNVHISIVVHPRKEDDDTPLGLSSVFGSVKSTQEADNVIILQRRRRTAAQAGSASSRTSRRGGGGLESSGVPPAGEGAHVTNYLELRKNRFSGELGNVPYVFNRNSLTIRELSPSHVDLEAEAALRASLHPPAVEKTISRNRKTFLDAGDASLHAEAAAGFSTLSEKLSNASDSISSGPVMAHAFDQLQRQRPEVSNATTLASVPISDRRGGVSGRSFSGGSSAFQVTSRHSAPPLSSTLLHPPSLSTEHLSSSLTPKTSQAPANALHASPSTASVSAPSPSSPNLVHVPASSPSLPEGQSSPQQPFSSPQQPFSSPQQPSWSLELAAETSVRHTLNNAASSPSASLSSPSSATSGDRPAACVRPHSSFVLSPDSPMPLLRELAHALPLTEPVKMSGASRTKAAVFEDLRRILERHPSMKRIAAAVVADFERKKKDEVRKRAAKKNERAGRGGTGATASTDTGDSGSEAFHSEEERRSSGGETRFSDRGDLSRAFEDCPERGLNLAQETEEVPAVKFVPLEHVLTPAPELKRQDDEEAAGNDREGTFLHEEPHVHSDACRLMVAQPLEPPADYIRSDFILVDSACKMKQLAPFLYRLLENVHPDDARYSAERLQDARMHRSREERTGSADCASRGDAECGARVGSGFPSSSEGREGSTAAQTGGEAARRQGESGGAAGDDDGSDEREVRLSMGVDVETTGLDPFSARIRLLQLALPDFPALLFDLFALPVSSPALRPVRLLLASPRIRKVFHNGQFDLCFLAAAGLADRDATRQEVFTEAQDAPESQSRPHFPTAVSADSRLKNAEKQGPADAAPARGDGVDAPGVSPPERAREARREQETVPGSEAGSDQPTAHAGPLLDAAVLGARPAEVGDLQSDGGVFVSGPLFDTLIAAKVVEAGVMRTGFKLLQVVERFLGVLMDKRMQASDWSSPHLSQEQLLYAARDAAVLLPLQQRLQQKLEAFDLQEVMDVEMRCLRPVVAMELNGMQIDHARWKELEAHLRREEEKARQRLAAELHVDENTVNFNSQKQMLDALRAIGIPAPPPDRPESRTRGSRFSFSELPLGFDKNAAEVEDQLLKDTSDGTLARLSQFPAVQALRDYRKAAKAITTFVDKLPEHINSVTGKIHCSLHQCGAGSGRFSCDSPNLQQIPRERRFRACFVPSKTVAGRPGKFIIADFSQIELRIAADLACDERMIEAYRKGEDLHRLTASLILNKPPSLLSKADRQLAKAVNFGLIYGMSADRFRGYASSAYGVEMSLQEARDFHAKYFSSYPGITRWHRRQKAEQPRETRTRAGRRALFEYFAFTKSLNYPIQGTSADITKESLVQLQHKLAPLGGRLVMCVHDEIIAEVPEEKAEEGLRVLIDTMEAAGNKYLRFVPCVAEGAIADSWADKP
ncbi:putative helicase, partial [Toxoplasma gondii RUB]